MKCDNAEFKHFYLILMLPNNTIKLKLELALKYISNIQASL